jgi:O-succinylhomoserine sulfhydrylase
MNDPSWKFETSAIRIQIPTTREGEHSTPLYLTSSFIFEDAEEMGAVFAGNRDGNIYARFTNPNVDEFATKMAALEGTEAAFATGSGMSAVYVSFMTFLVAGDHMLSTREIFGSTASILNNFLPKSGITYDYIDLTKPEMWDLVRKPNTKLLYLETPSNPGLAIFDIERISSFCKSYGILLVVDNCFATPYLQRPADFGADLVVHSATKYIDGQGRVLGGVICGNRDHVEKVKNFCRSVGPSLSPFNAWILSKSLETLAVRMDRHCDNAHKIATYLADHRQIKNLRYPYLPSHPQHELAITQMRQGGGMVSFEIEGGLSAGRAFLDGLTLFSRTANLGDTRSIVSHPASTTHARMTVEDKLAVGITDEFIRLSIGLEHVDDLIADLDQAFFRLKNK